MSRRFLSLLLVLAMVLGTVAVADQSEGTNTGNTTNDTYTITAGKFENGTLTIKYNSTQSPLTAGATSSAIAKGTEVTILAEPKAGYELAALNYTIGETTTDIKTDGKFVLTGNATVTPVFQAKSTLGGEKTADSFRLDAICSGSYYWQMYHKDMANNKKYTKYPGFPTDKVNPSSEIVKGASSGYSPV